MSEPDNPKEVNIHIRSNDPKNPLPELLLGTMIGGLAGYVTGSCLQPEMRHHWGFWGALFGLLYTGMALNSIS